MKILILISTLFWAGLALAESSSHTHVLMTPEEQALYQKTKKRLYPGGKDEDSLQVQSQLPQVSRKMAPAQEAPAGEEPEEHQESTAD
jgi:hypothetical protein